jgi:hypothetical protein
VCCEIYVRGGVYSIEALFRCAKAVNSAKSRDYNQWTADIQSWSPSQLPVHSTFISKLFPLAVQNVELFEALVVVSHSST